MLLAVAAMHTTYSSLGKTTLTQMNMRGEKSSVHKGQRGGGPGLPQTEKRQFLRRTPGGLLLWLSYTSCHSVTERMARRRNFEAGGSAVDFWTQIR